MPNTLTLAGTSPVTITLHDDLAWPDEFVWSATQMRRTYSAGGALLLDAGTKLAGRPITLVGDDSSAWMTRADLLTLRSWTDNAAATMTLVFRDVTYSVAFAAEDAPVTCRPIVDYSDPIGADYVVPSIRLITIA